MRELRELQHTIRTAKVPRPAWLVVRVAIASEQRSADAIAPAAVVAARLAVCPRRPVAIDEFAAECQRSTEGMDDADLWSGIVAAAGAVVTRQTHADMGKPAFACLCGLLAALVRIGTPDPVRVILREAVNGTWDTEPVARPRRIARPQPQPYPHLWALAESVGVSRVTA